MRIYTRRGDSGRTSLIGEGSYSKGDDRIEAVGSVDELNATIGLTLVDTKCRAVIGALESIQYRLFSVGALLAGANRRSYGEFSVEEIGRVEKEIDFLSARLPELRAFILPRGSRAVALLHLSRACCRRCERALAKISLDDEGQFGIVCAYLNRIADLLFVLARTESAFCGIRDVEWRPDSATS